MAFLLAFGLGMAVWGLRIEPGKGSRWVEGIFLVIAASSALVCLARRLPVQNVIMAAVLIIGLSGLLLSVGTRTGVPFGPVIFTDAMGPMLLDTVPWSMPVLWVVLILNGRGVARLIMRPWRKTNFYGYWVMGLTGLLVVHFNLGLEPLAVRVKHYWFWQTMETSILWYDAPWVNGLGWFVTALAILALTLPWLINKHPVKQPMDYQPLIQWALLQAWCVTGNLMHGHIAASVVGIGGSLLTLVYAIRGARW